MNKIAAGDPESRSADILTENLERLKSLFPDAFTEGKVDFEVLRQLLGDTVEEGEEKYGLKKSPTSNYPTCSPSYSTGRSSPGAASIESLSAADVSTTLSTIRSGSSSLPRKSSMAASNGRWSRASSTNEWGTRTATPRSFSSKRN